MPEATIAPRRGTIASRYLEAISCGGNDVSALSMSSGSQWLTPEHDRGSSAGKISHKNSIATDISCGMTAPTALLDPSASWTTMETRSRSDVASRGSGSNNPASRRVRSAGAGFCLAPSGSDRFPSGIDDECSSIESASSQGRPAHLSLEMDASFLDTSIQDAIELKTSLPVNPETPPPASMVRQYRAHRSEQRRRKAAQSKSPRSRTGGGGGGYSGGLFPKTAPRTPTKKPSPVDTTLLSSPYSIRRVDGLGRSGSRSPSPGRKTVSATERWSSKRKEIEENAAVASEAGAPTEIMTNLTKDVLQRSFPHTPVTPPSLNRRSWHPPSNARQPSSEAPPQQLLHSLIDETSTQEDSTTPSHDVPPMRSLLDAQSSSMSASASGNASRLELFVQHHNPKPFASTPTGPLTRLDMHVQNQQPNREVLGLPPDMGSLETGNTGTTGRFSLKAHNGTVDLGPSSTPKQETDPTRKINLSSKGTMYGGRAVGGKRRPNSTIRGLQTAAQPEGQSLSQTETEPARQQIREEASKLPLESTSTRTPTRFTMADAPIPQSQTPEKVPSYDLTASVSTTDALLNPDTEDRESKLANFVRYNRRKTPNIDEVFQKHASPNEDEDDPGQSSYESSFSDNQHRNGYPKNDTRAPIQPLFSLDRLDFSYDSQSPVRKLHSQAQKHDHPVVVTPANFQAVVRPPSPTPPPPPPVKEDRRPEEILEELQRQEEEEKQQYQQKQQIEQQGKSQLRNLNPVFCPDSATFSSPDRTEGSQTLKEDKRFDATSPRIRPRTKAPPSTSMAPAGAPNTIAANNQNSSSQNLSHRKPWMKPTWKARMRAIARNGGAKGGSRAASDNNEESETQKRTSPPTHIDISLMDTRPSRSHHDEDDDTASVKSLRERFEMIHVQENKNVVGHPKTTENYEDDNQSVKNLREKLEGRIFQDEDPANGDDGSVRGLKNFFETSLGPPPEKHAVDEKIQALNARQQKVWTPSTGKKWTPKPRNRPSRSSAEEKKDDCSHDMSRMVPRTIQYEYEDDDDTASVRSLKEKFEMIHLQTGQCYEDDDHLGDDDNASVRSLKEKLEQRIIQQENGIEDEPDDDDGSVRQLREHFEAPKQRGAKVNHLRSLFESKDQSSRFKRASHKPGVNRWQTKSKDHKNWTTSRQSNFAQKLAGASIVVSQLAENSALDSQLEEKEYAKTPGLSESRQVLQAGGQATTQDAKNGAVSMPDSNEILSDHIQSLPEQNIVSSIESPQEDYFGDDTNTRQGSELKHESHQDRELDRKVSSVNMEAHTPSRSRVRSPATSPFLAMRDRLLKFSSTTPQMPQAKKHEVTRTPPSMQERLNRWASRHQAAKQQPLAEQEERSEANGGGDLSEINRSGSYDLSAVGGDESENHVYGERNKVEVSSFFNKTNLALKKEQEIMHGPAMEDSKEKRGNHIFRNSTTSKSHSNESQKNTPGSHWMKDERDVASKHLSRADSKGKSNDTDYSDGVTLDVSIGEVSNLTNPSVLQSKGSKEAKEMEHHAGGMVPNANEVGNKQGQAQEETAWDIGQVDNSFPMRTPSTGDLFQEEETIARNTSSADTNGGEWLSRQVQAKEPKSGELAVKSVVEDSEEASPLGSSNSDKNHLSPAPSPFDKDYEVIMQSRHQMLLSRQRNHRRRKAARESKARNTERSSEPSAEALNQYNNEVSAESSPRSPGRKASSLVSPLTPSRNRNQISAIPSPRSSGFFGRTHPSRGRPQTGGSQLNSSRARFNEVDGPTGSGQEGQSPVVAYPPGIDRFDYKPERNRLHENLLTESQKAVQDYGSPKRETVSNTGDYYTSGEVSVADSAPSSHTRFTDPVATATKKRGRSRQEVLMARLKAVRAARLRRAAMSKTSGEF